MDDRSIFGKVFGNSPEVRIVDFFLDNKAFDFSKKDIIEATGMSKATFYQHWDRLEQFGIVKISRRFGKAKLYELDHKSPLVNQLFEVEKQLIRLAARKYQPFRKTVSA